MVAMLPLPLLLLILSLSLALSFVLLPPSTPLSSCLLPLLAALRLMLFATYKIPLPSIYSCSLAFLPLSLTSLSLYAAPFDFYSLIPLV